MFFLRLDVTKDVTHIKIFEGSLFQQTTSWKREEKRAWKKVERSQIKFLHRKSRRDEREEKERK